MKLEIMVNGNPLTKYYNKHNNQSYVVAQMGMEYTIRVWECTSSRHLAVVSVDGLSVMDGKPASAGSSGYIFNQSIDIPGWKIDGGSVAKFKFGGVGGSYASSVGMGENCGVIGCILVAEKPPRWDSGVVGGCIYDSVYRGLNTKPFGSAGTEFGRRHRFDTKAESFDRGDIIVQSSVRYETMERLVEMGILHASAEPNPFPGVGCTPPHGWRG